MKAKLNKTILLLVIVICIALGGVFIYDFISTTTPLETATPKEQQASQITAPDTSSNEDSLNTDSKQKNEKELTDSASYESEKTSETTSKNSTISDSAISIDLDDLPIYVDPRFRGPVGFDVLNYLRKDNAARGTTNKERLRALAHKRYDLNTEKGLNLAMTDISEIIRLCESDYYQKCWPKEESLAFADAVLEEILRKEPENYSALLLRAKLASKGKDSQKAFETYSSACEFIKEENDLATLTELADTAHHLLVHNELTSEQARQVKNLAYSSGLPNNCPLALYMEGKPSIVTMTNYRDRKDPYDFSYTIDLYESTGSFPQHFMTNTADIPSTAPYQVRLIDWAFRISTFASERDSRGLFELFGKLQNGKAPEELISLTEALAHSATGRFSAAIPLWESILEANESSQIPGTSTQAQYWLGLAYYEQGKYDKAKELLMIAMRDKMRITHERYDLVQEILSDIEGK